MNQIATSKRVVLTGAGGFLGTHLLPKLVGMRYSVVAVSFGDASRIEQAFGNEFPSDSVGIIESTNEQALREALHTSDVLLNCAFPRNTTGEQLASGLDFIAGLFRMAGEECIGAVVNISSQSVYSQHRDAPATEETPVCLESTYAVAKYATELLLDASCQDIPHTNIRLASLIGPGFDQRVVNKMVKRALNEGVIEVAENGSQFGYLDVEDAVDGLVALLGSDPSKWERCYNLGPDGTYTLTEIANTIKTVLEKIPIEIVSIPSTAVATNTALSSKSFQLLTQWLPKKNLRTSVWCIMQGMAV